MCHLEIPSDRPGSQFAPVFFHTSPGAQVQHADQPCVADTSMAVISLFHLPQFSRVSWVDPFFPSASRMAMLLKVSFNSNAHGEEKMEKPQQKWTEGQVKGRLKLQT